MAKETFIKEFGGERRRWRRLLTLLLILIILYLLTFGAIWVLIASPFFKIRDFAVSGSTQAKPEEVLSLIRSRTVGDSLAKKILGASNILVWPDNLSSEELRLLPIIKSVQIKKDLRAKRVLALVEERVPYGIWCLEGKIPAECYWFDEDGVVFKPAFQSEGNLIRVVTDYAREEFGGVKVLREDFLPALLSIFKVLHEANLSVKEISLKNLELEELEVSVRGGPKLYFSLRFPAEGAAEVIDSLKNKGQWNSLSYIDFRVEHRAYYK